MLVARFSHDIEKDIKRGFSCYQLPSVGGTYEENEVDAEEFGIMNPDIRTLVDEEGFGIVHHEGLSCYALESESVEGAIQEVKESAKMDGSGWAEYTIGKITVLATVEIGGVRPLHILEVEDVEDETE